MSTLLLILVYIAYISLGIPDALLGAAWPAMYPELGLPISFNGLISLFMCGCTLISSLFSGSLLRRFGTSRVTVVSTALTVVGLYGYSISGSIVFLLASTVPLGLGAGAVDVCLNTYIALHCSAKHISFLHCFYGIGVSVSPYIISLALMSETGWRGGYRVSAGLQALMLVLLFLSLPLWKGVDSADTGGDDHTRSSVRALAGRADVRMVWLYLFACSGLEYICGFWSSTFLVNCRGLSPEIAAQYVSFFYIGLTVGRFLSGVVADKWGGWPLIHTGCILLACGIFLLALPLPAECYFAVLLIMGLGVAPNYPNMVLLTPRNFGRDLAPAVMGTQMAAAYTGIMLAPPVFGFAAQFTGTDLFPYALALYLVLTAFSSLRLKALARQKAPAV